MNLAVDTLPQFQCCKLSHPDAGPQHVGTIHIGSERYAVSSVCIVLLVLVPCVFWSAYILEMLSKEGEKQFSIFNHCIVCPIITRERVESGKSFLLIFWPVNVTCS